VRPRPCDREALASSEPQLEVLEEGDTLSTALLILLFYSPQPINAMLDTTASL
jgi:hypothetical protein